MKKNPLLIIIYCLLQYSLNSNYGSVIDPVVTNSAIFTLGNLQAAAIKIKGSSTSGGNSLLIGANTNDYYSQGNLTLMSTNILGNITLCGSLSNSASSYGTLTQASSPLYNFMAIEQSLINVSNELGQIPPNGTAIQGTKEDLLLTGSDPEINVFRIANPDFYSSIQIVVPPKATAIVNIMGTKPFLLQNNFNSFKDTSQNVDPSMVLFNFPQAKSITINSGTISGTLFAPLASSTVSKTSITGGIITQNMVVKGTALLGVSYKGAFVSSQKAPEPESIILSLISVFLIIVLRWSR